MLTQMLGRLGYTVVSETDSMNAVEIFRSQPEKFDLVITDYAMPKMTGENLIKELLSIRDNISIILCTGFSDNIDAEKARSIGAKEFVMKPIDKTEFALIIQNVLDKKEMTV